jgi:hypothetical protein
MNFLHRTRGLALALTLAALAFPVCAQGQASAAQDALARFPVAHEHNGSWCLGYLYIYPDSIAYDATWPAADKSHSFTIKRPDIQGVGRWTRSGQPLKALELKSPKTTYHFWWLANEQDVVNGRTYQKDPSDAGDPDFLIAAIRDPATLTTGPSSQAAPPNSGPATASQLQQIPNSPFAASSQAVPSAAAPSSANPGPGPASQLQQVPASPFAASMQGAPPATAQSPQPYNPLAAAGGAASPVSTAPTEIRFSVAHSHAVSDCVGYLYVSESHVRYEVVQPQSDKKHSFDLPRSEIAAIQQWVFAGTPLNAVEIRTARASYHFWLLADNSDLVNTPPTKLIQRGVLPVGPLIAALQGQR